MRVTRERDRYRRASIREQVSDELRGIWANRTARVVIGVLLLGWLVMLVLTPRPLRMTELAAGDCVYLRAPGTSDLGSDTPNLPATERALAEVTAGERASCDLSHSHEVSTTFRLEGPDDYPGWDTLVALNSARCDAAFEEFVGHGLAGSRYATAIWVPPPAAWTEGERDAACLVFDRNGAFLGHHLRGSGE
jgi:hypothetical protein